MGSSSGAQSKSKAASSQIYRTIKIKNTLYNVWLRFKANDFSVHLESDKTGEHWFNAFTPDYIDEMTRKTGNQRRYDVFTSMLATALEKTSSRRSSSQQPLDLSLDLLFVEDLERMKEASGGVHNESIDATIQSAANKSRCFLIIAYAVEFERTFYPLPLNKSGPPSTSLEEWLLFAYRLCKEQLRKAQEESNSREEVPSVGSADIQMLRAEIKRQRDIIAALENERNKALEVTKHIATENRFLKDQMSSLKSSMLSRTTSAGRPSSRDQSKREARSTHSSVKTSRVYTDQPIDNKLEGRSQRYYRERETSKPPSRTQSQVSSRSATGVNRRSSSRHISEQPSPATAGGYLHLSHARSHSASVGNSQALYGSNTSNMSASLNPFKRTQSLVYSSGFSEFDEGPSQQIIDKAKRSSSRGSENRHRRRSTSSRRHRDGSLVENYPVDSGTTGHSSRSHAQRSAQYEEYPSDRHRSGSSRRKHRREHSGTSRSEKYY